MYGYSPLNYRVEQYNSAMFIFKSVLPSALLIFCVCARLCVCVCMHVYVCMLACVHGGVCVCERACVCVRACLRMSDFVNLRFTMQTWLMLTGEAAVVGGFGDLGVPISHSEDSPESLWMTAPDVYNRILLGRIPQTVAA